MGAILAQLVLKPAFGNFKSQENEMKVMCLRLNKSEIQSIKIQVITVSSFRPVSETLVFKTTADSFSPPFEKDVRCCMCTFPSKNDMRSVLLV